MSGWSIVWLLLAIAFAVFTLVIGGTEDGGSALLFGAVVGGFFTLVIMAVKALINAVIRRVQDGIREREEIARFAEQRRRRDLENEQLLRRMRDAPDPVMDREIPRDAPRGGSARLMTLHDVTLILEDPRNQRTVGRLVNREEVARVRPVVIFTLNAKKFVGKLVVIEFIVRGPRGGEKYRVAIEHIFVLGRNRVFPKKSALPINPNSAKGSWTIEVWMQGREYASQTFSVTTGRVDDDFAQLMAADGELTPEAMALAGELAGAIEIDDILA